MGDRFTTLALGALLVAGTALPGIALAAETDRYRADPARGVFAVFEGRDGNERSLTTVFASRGAGEEVDGDPIKAPVVLVWSSTWNAKKGKVRRVAFGAADPKDVEVKVASDLTSGSVEGKVRVEDVVKDENYTLDLDLEWTKDDGKENLNFDETYEPDADDGGDYTEELSFGGDKRDGDAKGDILRGGTNLAEKKGNPAFIMEFDDAEVSFTYP